ncbi:MAG: hypothetical protein ACRDDZ_01300 [Marinifilaceae bacterium]
MYTKKETEYQYHPVIINMIEDYAGGATLERGILLSTDELKPGHFVGVVAGLAKVFKTAEVNANVAADGKSVQLKKGHEFKTDDFIATSALTGASTKISAITIGTDYDTITLTATLGALTAGAVLVQAKTEAAAGSAQMPFDVEGVTVAKVDLTVPNQQVGICVRGTVNKALIAQPIDANVLKLFPLIRFK